MEALYIPLILGLTEAAKKAGLPTQYAPLISIIIGVGLAVFAFGSDFNSVGQGIIFGLSASGLWSGSKAILTK